MFDESEVPKSEPILPDIADDINPVKAAGSWIIQLRGVTGHPWPNGKFVTFLTFLLAHVRIQTLRQVRLLDLTQVHAQRARAILACIPSTQAHDIPPN